MHTNLLPFKLLLIGGEIVEPVTMVENSVNGGCEVECVKCECCGLTEECTATYIATVRESNYGRWICGLCAEAVKEEMERGCARGALDRHMRVCKKFRSSMMSSPAEELISAVKHLLIRSLDSPRSSSRQSDGNRLSRSFDR
ncbi:hypothetical protein QVD17_27482 [Tagetes erecta]|uniref:Uncharacterized protein n=1 Tax=Tagetes erecta TaxID=13708 RepID=A0AAD8NR50_TARER|nr:hypothetical protein QVD17_27482 [Tagetes erecta]